jgi:hypothetical protein
MSTGALIAWLVVPLAVIGLWVTADVLTERPGGRVPSLAGSAGRGLSQALRQLTTTAALLAGVWTNTAAAKLDFAANGHVTEIGLPGPPPGDTSMAGMTVPRSAAGTWELYGSSVGYQQVLLTFASRVQLDLGVRRRSFGHHGASYFVFQMYRGAA